jgi:hypothetical protein
MMTLDDFIACLGNDDSLLFAETMAMIDAHYEARPTAFRNGSGDDLVRNAADHNQGSCRIFAFGRLNGLTEQQTLACFGEHYRHVLANPDGSDHANIRAFMRHGWSGIHFDNAPLRPRRT